MAMVAALHDAIYSFGKAGICAKEAEEAMDKMQSALGAEAAGKVASGMFAHWAEVEYVNSFSRVVRTRGVTVETKTPPEPTEAEALSPISPQRFVLGGGD